VSGLLAIMERMLDGTIDVPQTKLDVSQSRLFHFAERMVQSSLNKLL